MIPPNLSHYRVLEKIGSGGMGLVYRAHDETLDRDVALKVLPTGMLSDEHARRRFRREALSLAKLNHPHIGGVYEFGSEGGVDFLVMELVSGVTLDARLAGGPMEDAEVLRYGAQLADGLEAAHQQGILHRDLKPSNLRINKEGRLKILDFGLAEWTQPEGDSDPTATNTKVSGTVAYMSPEQLRGKNADVRSDIYAVGAVLYEMATGKHPYAESSGPQLIAQILDRPPSPPTSRNRKISPVLEAIILKAMDRDPDLRYQSAREMRIDLERLSSGSTSIATRRRPVWPWVLAAGAALAAVLLVWNPADIRGRILGGRTGSFSSHGRRAVAVVGFRNLSGKPEQAWLSTALAEMLSTELGGGGKLRSVPGENIARMKLDLSLPDAESYAPDTLARIRKHSGTDLVVLGSYMAMGNDAGNRIRIDFHLQDAATGETLASVSETGTEPELLDLVARTGSRLRSTLGVQTTAGETAGAHASSSLPSTNEAARLYAEGLSKLRLFEAREARSLLERAANLDPKFALSHAAVSEALTNLGYDALAREEAQKAFDLSASLSRDERLMIEGRLREATREWPKAVETYRTLWRFFPDNLEYGLRLAAAQTAAGQPKDALATVEEMRRATNTANGDPRIDLAEAKAYDKLGSFKQSLGAAQTAGKIGEANGARLVVAQARIAEGWAWERLGERGKAAVAFAEAHDLFSAAGDKRGAATATHLNGHLLYDQGNYAEANRTYQSALAVFREIGDQQNAAGTLNNLGNVASDTGDFPKAMSYYEQTLAIDRETGSKGGVAGALGNMANVFDSMGDLPNARKKNEEGLAMFREVGDQRGTASTLGNLGNVLVEIGELTDARKHYEEGLKIQKETGYRRGQAYALSNLADLLTVTGDFSEARKLAEQALALRKELGENINVAISQLQMGWIAFNETRLNEAEASLRDAALAFQKADMRDLLISCHALLARVLLAQGKTAEAGRLATDSVQMAKSRPSRPPQFDAALALASVRTVEGKFADAAKVAQEVLNLASRYGYAGYQMESRLVLAQVLARSGKASRARVQAAALQKDARAKGYGRIERETAKLVGL
jgi:serine/threonine protein kinase/tetratricopeptide (TPR) repeat protein